MMMVMKMNDTLIFRERGKDPLYKTWHASSRALFLYVYSGSGSLVTKERNYPIRENALILIAPGTYHYTMPDEPQDYVRSKLILSYSKYMGLSELQGVDEETQKLMKRPVVYAQIPRADQEIISRIFEEARGYENMESEGPLWLSCALRLLFYLNN